MIVIIKAGDCREIDVLEKPLLCLVKRTVAEKALRDHDVLKESML